MVEQITAPENVTRGETAKETQRRFRQEDSSRDRSYEEEGLGRLGQLYRIPYTAVFGVEIKNAVFRCKDMEKKSVNLNRRVDVYWETRENCGQAWPVDCGDVSCSNKKTL